MSLLATLTVPLVSAGGAALVAWITASISARTEGRRIVRVEKVRADADAQRAINEGFHDLAEAHLAERQSWESRVLEERRTWETKVEELIREIQLLRQAIQDMIADWNLYQQQLRELYGDDVPEHRPNVPAHVLNGPKR